MKLPSPFIVLFLATFMPLFVQAQTPAYTQSVLFGCNQNVCNGIPLDGGGTAQFIEANGAFSISSSVSIFGNGGNPGSGGMSNVQDKIPYPPRINYAKGADGTITFSWAAVNSDRSLHYTGHTTAQGYRESHCNNHGCWVQLFLENSRYYIDSVPTSHFVWAANTVDRVIPDAVYQFDLAMTSDGDLPLNVSGITLTTVPTGSYTPSGGTATVFATTCQPDPIAVGNACTITVDYDPTTITCTGSPYGYAYTQLTIAITSDAGTLPWNTLVYPFTITGVPICGAGVD